MAASKSILCEPCEHNGITTCADTWCNDCEEGFCGDCIKGHQLSKRLRDHHYISITDYMKISSLSIDTNCPDHNKKYEFFCPQHDVILCRICFQLDHSKCEISDLAEASKGSKNSTALTDIERDIKCVLANLSKALEFEDLTLAHLINQEQTIKKKIKEAQKYINAHLDKLQEQLLDELKKKFEECQAYVREQHRTFKQKEKEMMTLRDTTSSLKNYASEMQTFIGIKAAGKILLDHNTAVRSLFTKLSRPRLDVKFNSNVQTLLRDIKELGKIKKNVEENQSLTFNDSLSKQAQLNMSSLTDIAEIKLHPKQTVKINKGGKDMSLTSCVLMPNKEMVFVDNSNGRIIVHSANGKHMTDLNVCSKPFDVTVVDSSRIAVTCEGSLINLINIDTGKVEEICGNFSSDKIWGIKCLNEMIYGVAFGGFSAEIIVMNLQGNIIHRIPLSDTETFNIAIYGDIIYVICTVEHSLHAYEKSGKKIWTFRDKRLCQQKCFRQECFSNQYSTSMTVDNCGNVYLALADDDIVLVVSSDGKKHRVILNKLTLLNQPSGVSFLKETNQLLVCNRTNGHATIYDLNG